ncbi:MAG: hypothetical protein CW716_00070 [Candidatus Bathyarchaeum sp.]|nr:hypothetical protein [Candidatus Bathyarchaeota archaeon]PVX27869.1 MAG: hypothetical protein CW716_00070 [Candidatus Bathyarchaeum sp.]
MKSMSGPRILCVVVSLGGYDKTVESINRQTCPVSKLVIANKPFPEFKYIGERAGMAMRDALSKECLDDFTHILRVDGDTVLPKNFVEESLKSNADLVGCGGYAQLLTVSVFKDLFAYIYPVDFAEDTVISQAVIRSPHHVYSKYVVNPVNPLPKKYPITSWIKNGEARYRIGISFLLTCLSFRDRRSSTLVGFKSILIVMGFLRAKMSGCKQYSFVTSRSLTKY